MSCYSVPAQCLDRFISAHLLCITHLSKCPSVSPTTQALCLEVFFVIKSGLSYGSSSLYNNYFFRAPKNRGQGLHLLRKQFIPQWQKCCVSCMCWKTSQFCCTAGDKPSKTHRLGASPCVEIFFI